MSRASGTTALCSLVCRLPGLGGAVCSGWGLQPGCRGLEAPPRVDLACSVGVCLGHGTLFTFSWPWALGPGPWASLLLPVLHGDLLIVTQQLPLLCSQRCGAFHSRLSLPGLGASQHPGQVPPLPAPWSFYLSLQNAVEDPQDFGTGKVIFESVRASRLDMAEPKDSMGWSREGCDRRLLPHGH